MGCLWEFTREHGLQEVQDDTLNWQEGEEEEDWINRLGFEPKVTARSWGIYDNFNISLYEGPHPPYLLVWNIDGHFNFVLINDFPDFLEFLRTYLPIISHTLQIQLLENFLDELEIPNELAKNVIKFVRCVQDLWESPSNLRIYVTETPRT